MAQKLINIINNLIKQIIKATLIVMFQAIINIQVMQNIHNIINSLMDQKIKAELIDLVQVIINDHNLNMKV